MASKTAIGRRAKTLQKYRSQLARFASQYHELPMDPALLEEFLEGVGGQPATRDTYYRTLSTFYHWLIRRGLISTNPIIVLEAPKVPETTPTILSLGELQHLLTFEGHSWRDRSLLLFLVDTGARIGEAAGLRVEDLRDGYVILTGKDGQRFAPISLPVAKRLMELHDASPRSPEIWQGRQGPLTHDALVHMVIKAFRRAGFQGKRHSAHALRHTFGTVWEGDELVLQQIFGHTRLDMVKRYRQFRMTRARQQHALHSPLAQLELGL